MFIALLLIMQVRRDYWMILWFFSFLVERRIESLIQIGQGTRCNRAPAGAWSLDEHGLVGGADAESLRMVYRSRPVTIGLKRNFYTPC